jgi:hypothetical protein
MFTMDAFFHIARLQNWTKMARHSCIEGSGMVNA